MNEIFKFEIFSCLYFDGTLLFTFTLVVSKYFPVFFARAIFFTCKNMTSNSVHTKIPLFREFQAPDKGILSLIVLSLPYILFGTLYIVPRFIASFFSVFDARRKPHNFLRIGCFETTYLSSQHRRKCQRRCQ